MNDCDHYKRIPKWISEEHFITVEIEDRLVDDWISTTVDIDLYSFKCTHCGKIEYYSKPIKK